MVKRSGLFLIFIALFTQGCVTTAQTGLSKSPTKISSHPVIDTCFRPGKVDCVDKITALIANAKQSILVQAYTFTLKPIADAIISAKNKGVSVKVILDKSQLHAKYSVLPLLFKAGIPIWIDNKPAIAHNKIMIIDQAEVITGSFNFSASAEERNAENLVFIIDPQVSATYVQYWYERQAKSEPYNGSKKYKKC